MQKDVDARRGRRHSQNGERGSVIRELDGKARGRRPDERRDRAAERESGEVLGSFGCVAERADEAVHRNVEEDVSEADQRRAEEQGRESPAPEGQKQSRRHRHAAERDGQAHAVAIRDAADLDGEQQRKQREQRGEDADLGGARAQIERVERNRHLAAALRDRVEDDQRDDEVDRARSSMSNRIRQGGTSILSAAK